jgi:8-oxo-dGTP diphosphatase
MTLKLAGCIITDDQGRILLLHRNTPKRTQWEIPGGKIDAGESDAETVIREADEELGVEIRLIKRLGDKAFTEDQFTMHYAWFQAAIQHGEPHIAEPETFDDLRYWSREELAGHLGELSPNTRNFLIAIKLTDLA